MIVGKCNFRGAVRLFPVVATRAISLRDARAFCIAWRAWQWCWYVVYGVYWGVCSTMYHCVVSCVRPRVSPRKRPLSSLLVPKWPVRKTAWLPCPLQPGDRHAHCIENHIKGFATFYQSATWMAFAFSRNPGTKYCTYFCIANMTPCCFRAHLV